MAEHGKDGYYKGRIAKEIVKVLADMGGVMTEEDLASHYTTFPTPIMTNYRGVEVWEIPPNGQGLAALIGLNILEGYDVAGMGHNSPQLLHTMIETMRLAFADAQRCVHLPFYSRTKVKTLRAGDCANTPRPICF